ncbi:MAG: ABC transporter permease [Actinomycetota bacterium]
MESRSARFFIKLGSVIGLLFLYVPLALVLLYSFNASVGQKWPISEFTTRYWSLAWHSSDVRDALLNSTVIASAATLLALLLGSLAAFAVHRFQFFGRNTVSLLLVLPIALPGIVTAVALSASLDTFGFTFGLFTIMIGHATFCIVVVYNNVIARLRRTPGSFIEASMDLGANGWQTFRMVTFPAIRTAIVAGALLAFALSFDEIIVTNFLSGTQITIPKFIYNNLRQPRNRPIVNVVAVGVTVAMLIPVYIAQRIAGGGADIATPTPPGRREGPTDTVTAAAAAQSGQGA